MQNLSGIWKMLGMRNTVIFCLLTMILLAPGLLLGQEVRTIVIDAGHGGYDLGIRTHQVGEKDFMLSIARRLQRVIESTGRFAYLSREVDHYMSLEDRRAATNKHEADLFISLHMSSSDTFTVYVTWFDKKDADLELSEYYSVDARQRRHIYESTLLARNVSASLREAFAVNVYEKEMSLPLLDGMAAPAVMVEIPSIGLDFEKDSSRLVAALYNGLAGFENGR